MKACLFVVALAAATPALAQSSAERMAAIRDLVNSHTYVFVPQTAMPSRGSTHQILDNFELRITTNSVASNLPYFGQAYVAPIDPTKGPLTFTSHKFEYTVTPGKKEGWEVLIRPQDLEYTDVQRMTLDISAAGYTSVRVLFTNRDPISFTGTITAPQGK
jgi:hypothetical protein